MEPRKKFENIQRPPLRPAYLDSGNSLRFLATDIHYVENSTNSDTDLRVFGVTQEGNSVLAHVHSFRPYFWVECPQNCDNQVYANKLKAALNGFGRGSVTNIEIHTRESIMFYTPEGPKSFFKVFTEQPKQVAALRGALERGVEIDGIDFGGVTYESNVPFVLRFMIDSEIVGMSWVEIKGGNYSFTQNKISTSQVELEVNYEDLVPHKPEGEWSLIPPLRILSFDIECNNDGEHFCTPDKNEVIQIGNVCKIAGTEEIIARNIFTLGGCSEIADADVFSFKNEAAMLQAWRDFVVEVDPDIITGYNILNFDYSYLFGRADKLKIKDFSNLGRIKNKRISFKDSTFQSKAQGIRDTKEVVMEGRVQLDMLQHIQREHKLSQYSLNSVSLNFLKEQKEDVHWTIIKDLQAGTDDSRRRIAVYCLKDCYLPLRLLEKLMCIFNYTEMARVTGVPFSYLCTRGQQIKVLSQLLRKARSCNMLIPTQTRGDRGDKFEGAVVIEPKPGFYKTPIATLDFASLYPSIMMAHNLCYCTLVPPSVAPKLDKDSFIVTPTGEKFMKAEHRKGLLPIVLEELLAARKKARAELAQTTDPFMQKVLDGRQLALKISANSVYGFTGAQAGQLPCLQISGSVTSYGRQMIDKTKAKVEEYYSSANGFDFDAEVIYGDTDSVMVNFGDMSLEKIIQLGNEASQVVTAEFTKPIKLEFEKVYYPYLLMAKKRYAGLLWTKPENYDKIDMKGIESVRRDNCSLVRNTINTCLSKLLIERDVDAAVEFVKNTVASLLQNKVDLSMLVITKALGKRTAQEGKTGKNTYTAKQAHVELAQKMQARDAATAPSVGDRVAYVMIKGVKGQKAYELAEDPLYALKNNLPIDFEYYLEKQLKLPLSRLFDAIIPNTSTLFYGEHTRKKFTPKPTTGALAKFIKVANTCISCKTQIKEGALCKACYSKAPQVYLEKTLQANQFEKAYQELWSECQRCQGSVCEEVLCTNRDCPIFYRREKVRQDMQRVRGELDKMSLSW